MLSMFFQFEIKRAFPRRGGRVVLSDHGGFLSECELLRWLGARSPARTLIRLQRVNRLSRGTLRNFGVEYFLEI
jgi:hypothetical protein